MYTKEILDLNAMEVQFVRGLYVMEDEEATFMKEYAVENDKLTQEKAEAFFNLSSYVKMTTIGSLIMGLLTSAIVAVFLKKG